MQLAVLRRISDTLAQHSFVCKHPEAVRLEVSSWYRECPPAPAAHLEHLVAGAKPGTQQPVGTAFDPGPQEGLHVENICTF